MFSKAFVSVSAAALVAGILGVAALQVREVAHACDFAWSGPNNPTLTYDPSTRNYGGTSDPKELETSVVLFSGESTFTLNLAWVSGTSVRIQSCSISPSSFLNAGNDNGTSVHLSNLTGQVTSDTQNSTLKVSAWNNEHPELCSEEHSRAVNHP